MQSVVQGEIGNFVVLEQNAYSVRPVLGTPWYSTRIRAMAHRDLDICEVVEIVEPDLDISKEKR